MVEDRIRGWLAPLLRLYDRGTIWREPMIAGSILGVVMLFGGLTGAVIGFAIGFFGAMITRIYIRTMQS
jgi:hypothetical protein